jgi:hypothetical protein
MITTKGALYEYMDAHPELVLQWHRGIRFNSWWWLRDGQHGSSTIKVHARAAQSLRANKLLKLVHQEWDSETYALVELQSIATAK